jgi:hypothetical protein
MTEQTDQTEQDEIELKPGVLEYDHIVERDGVSTLYTEDMRYVGLPSDAACLVFTGGGGLCLYSPTDPTARSTFGDTPGTVEIPLSQMVVMALTWAYTIETPEANHALQHLIQCFEDSARMHYLGDRTEELN